MNIIISIKINSDEFHQCLNLEKKIKESDSKSDIFEAQIEDKYLIQKILSRIKKSVAIKAEKLGEISNDFQCSFIV